MQRGITSRFFLVVIIAFLSYAACYAADVGIEKELQAKLNKSRALLEKAKTKLSAGLSITDEIAELQAHAEDIKTSDVLLQERFRLRQETADQLGARAGQRHRAMEEGYLKALGEYLALIESLQQGSSQQSALSSQLNSLTDLLERILPKGKRPIFGILPYRNLNYPAGEPLSTPSIKPAYRGGNKVVSPDDTKDTEEAPLSLEIATLAQSLNWKPVAIYEYVKNNISTEWYWGCMKGAEETLRQRSGNDCDQATLLAAMLRASGFPTRYVRGTIEFFPDIEKAKNLTGIEDPLKMAEFFQKAGIPYKPVIQGGKIANIGIEHIWIESRIPYGNYRGTMIDDSDPTWLGLDTSITPKGYTYNTPPELSADSAQLSAIKDEYLSAVQTGTPLEYFKERLSAISGQAADSYKLTRSLIPESMKILPDSMQFDQKKITHEYTEIPEDLKHNVKLSAFSNQPTVNSGPLFEITLPLYDLSNQQIIMTYEPETVEDQQIIDSYGGLDNTPAYLVRLRPVLKVNGERIVVGKDGLPMGEDYKLILELISPNGTETITNTHIIGNLTAIGIVAQRALSSQDSAISAEDDAETILYKEANRYIDRWNEAEDELASLLHLNISRPIPTVVTVGGVIDVTYLLDMPHGFEWKGVFIDAGLRAVSVQPSAVSNSAAADRHKTFMQLAGLQGSILENRIFEDDFQVESISTAKLIQIVGANGGSPILTIDKTNIAAVLSASDLDDNIKEDITNAVNQNYIVRMPSADGLPLTAISYLDWSGIGYIKEKPETGEAGYMLSGMIAGGMTAIKKEDWKKQDVKNTLSRPSSKTANDNPDAVEKIVRFGSGNDYQSGIVGKQLKRQFEVIALDSKGIPVKGVSINFKVVSGGSKVQGENSKSEVVIAPASEVTVLTGPDGIARARLTLGTQTADSPYYRQETNAAGGKYWELEGLNLVSVSASTTKKRMTTDKPFEAYGKPGAAAQMVRLNPTTDIYGPPSVFASLLWVKIVDQHGNSISDKNVQYKIKREYLGTPPSSGAINAKLFGEMTDCPGVATIDCSKAKEADVTPFEKRTEYFGVHPYLIMGNTENTKYTITATAFKDAFDSQGRRIDNKTALNSAAFTFYTKAVENAYVSLYAPYAIDAKGNKIDAWKAGEIFPEPLSAAMFYTEKTKEGILKIMPVVKDPPVDAPYKNDAKVEFFVASGEGGVRPSNYQPVDPKAQLKFELSALQTVDDPINKGTYAVTLKLGSTPGMNRINAIGTVTASVPSYDAQGNVTRTDRTLAASYPIELWGIKIAVDEPKYRQLVLNNNGYPVSDLEIKYSIDPLLYQYQKSEVSLVISEQLSDAYAGFVQADSNGRLILSEGGAKFDREKSYYAEVVLNRGTRAEVRSEKIPLINAALIPDYDRNGVIDDADRERTAKGDTFYFWINDDDDGGETDGSDIPLSNNYAMQPYLNYSNNAVNGTRDLIDFFPVYLDIDNLLKNFDPIKYAFKLISEDESLNFVLTDLEALHAGYYLRGDDNNLQIPYDLGHVNTARINEGGTFLNNHPDKPGFLEGIKSRKTGVVLIEGKKASLKPLELVVLDANQKTVFSMKLNLSLSGVEEMFRHKNLTRYGVVPFENGPVPKAGSNAGELDRLSQPSNYPDKESTGTDLVVGKNVVFVHGYNVNGQEARGWQSEMFKRMFWSGSKAKFWGVTWYGWDTQEFGPLTLPFTPNYHVNVIHAFNTVPEFKNFLLNTVEGEITIAAHSLGNMLVSAALTNNGDVWDASGQIKNYFMLDAAVAAEAYGSLDNSNEIEMNKDTVTNPNMIHPDWTSYKKELWASEWHLLFKGQSPTDNREYLTWRNMFAKRPASVTYYNFFSQGEEVLDEHEGELKFPDVIEQFKQTGIYTWALQEKLKGKSPVDGILGSNYGGWGFNSAWDVFDVNIMEMRRRTPAEAAGIESPLLRATPFYLKGNESTLFDEVAGSNYALQNKIRLLADAIPARTLAAGKKAVPSLLKDESNEEVNFDMQTLYKTKIKGMVYWPEDRSPKNWRHGDAREVAYSYVYSLFDKFVGLGGLK